MTSTEASRAGDPLSEALAISQAQILGTPSTVGWNLRGRPPTPKGAGMSEIPSLVLHC